MKLDNPHVKPGQKVYVKYNLHKSEKKFTVAVSEHNCECDGWILVEVTDKNRDYIIRGWKGHEHRPIVNRLHLELEKSYWWIDNWTFKPTSKLDI